MYLGIYGDIVEKGNGGDVVMGGYNIKGELSKRVGVDPIWGLISQAAYFAKCPSSIGPLVDSWMAAGNQSSGIEERIGVGHLSRRIRERSVFCYL